MLSNGSNLYSNFQRSFAQLTISIHYWNSCNSAGQVHDTWLDIRKGLIGVSFECFPSVHPFGVFWPLPRCRSSEKWWSSRQENITKVNTTNKTPTKTSENNKIFFCFPSIVARVWKEQFHSSKRSKQTGHDWTLFCQLFCLHVQWNNSSSWTQNCFVCGCFLHQDKHCLTPGISSLSTGLERWPWNT